MAQKQKNMRQNLFPNECRAIIQLVAVNVQKKKKKKKCFRKKTIDLLEKKLHKPKKFLSFKKTSESINEIKLKWTEKLKKHQADGYSKQECLNLRKESERLKILEFLKSQALPAPFKKPVEVKFFMKSNITLQKNKDV